MKRPLPATLVTGFLGAGKTSVLHHYLSEIASGPVALLVDAGGSVNLDARQLRGLSGAMSRPHDQLLDLHQRLSLLPEVQRLADEGSVNHVVIETSGLENPIGLVQKLMEIPSQTEPQFHLAQIICVVDALAYFHEVVAASSTSVESFSAFMQKAQAEAASLIVLNKCDLVSETERDHCIESLCRLNPTARWLETTQGGLPREAWDTSVAGNLPRNFEGGKKSPLAKRDLPECLSFQRPRPFHPGRFWQWFQAKHPGVLRVKGLFWLATRNLLVGGLSRTPRQTSCGPAGIWWAALPREDWPQEETSLRAMQENWSEPYGDRRQELVLIGDAQPLRKAQAELEECLLSQDEFALPLARWREMSDPFPAWDLDQRQG